MGCRDSNTIYSDRQAVTAVATTASTNVYDSGSADASDIGLGGDDLWLTAYATGMTSAGAATVTPVLQHSDDNATFADALVGPTTAVATGPNAVLWQTRLPAGLKRFTRVGWRVATAALTGGVFTAFIAFDVQRNIARPSGFEVA